ncbi:TatD family hydrolase [soil metagenome]
MRLIDSHCHVQADAFASDAFEVLAAARLAGVERVMVPGWDLESSRAAVALARRTDVQASAGIHPHVAAQADDAAWREVVELAATPEIAAIGETGLDYDRGMSPREAQLENLRRHLALARAVVKPVILHCRSKPGERDAQDDLLRELAVTGGDTPALLHSFSGPVDYGERALELGLTVSFSGLVFRTGEEASAEFARVVPADRLLVETDSPYLSPPGAPRRRNEPEHVAITARWLAETRGDDPASLGDQLVANYDGIFSRRPT